MTVNVVILLVERIFFISAEVLLVTGVVLLWTQAVKFIKRIQCWVYKCIQLKLLRGFSSPGYTNQSYSLCSLKFSVCVTLALP